MNADAPTPGASTLIGMYDSSYARRVAITMDLLGLPFEHRAWSVGRDFDRIRACNPLGRAPTRHACGRDLTGRSAAICRRRTRAARSAW